MKYIPADKLIAEIERLKDETPIGICEYDKGEENGRMEVLTSLQSTIAALQQEQPEVDLAEEITKFFSKNPIPPGHITVWPLLKNTAIHFSKFGLNARKEE